MQKRADVEPVCLHPCCGPLELRRQDLRRFQHHLPISCVPLNVALQWVLHVRGRHLICPSWGTFGASSLSIVFLDSGVLRIITDYYKLFRTVTYDFKLVQLVCLEPSWTI